MSVNFSCSDEAKENITHALTRLPKEVVESKNYLFVCVDYSDARRLVMKNYKGYEIIVFSEFVVPRDRVSEDHWSKRYFYFVVFHEIAHAHLEHVSPREISKSENQKQEAAADELAFEWMNNYCERTKSRLFTENELSESQSRVKSERMKYLKILNS